MLTRRSLVGRAAALGVTLLAGGADAAQSSTPSASTGWETHVGAPGGLGVAWDPALWTVLREPEPDHDTLWLVDIESAPDAEADQHLLAASHTPLPWETFAEVEEHALDYRFPTRKPTVLGTWTTDDATGFASVGGDADNRGFNYSEFSTTGVDGVWREIVISIPVDAFDSDRVRDLYRSVNVDGAAIPRATDLDAVIDVFALRAEAEE